MSFAGFYLEQNELGNNKDTPTQLVVPQRMPRKLCGGFDFAASAS